MTTMEQLDQQVLQKHLGQLDLETFANLPAAELEWNLSDFLLSWGQSLLLDPADWPSDSRRDELRRFGLTVWPFSTAADFPTVRTDQVCTLAMALSSLNLYVMLIDPIVDEPLSVPASAKLCIQSVLLHFYRLSGSLFPSSSPFWSELVRELNVMSQTMLEEHQRSLGPVQPFSWEEFKRIAQAKMAFVRVNCIGMATLNGTPELIPELTRCWDAISLASIINDDTLDWRQDYKNANYTYLLSQVLFSPPFREQVQSGQRPQLAEIAAALFCTDAVESLHSVAHEELTAAARRAADIQCPALAQLIQRVQAKMDSRFRKIVEHKLVSLIDLVGDDVHFYPVG